MTVDDLTRKVREFSQEHGQMPRRILVSIDTYKRLKSEGTTELFGIPISITPVDGPEYTLTN